MSTAVTRIGTSEVDAVTDLVARAFTGNPIIGWLATDMPDQDATRHHLFRDYFRLFVEHAVTAGSAEATRDGLGIALWFLPDSGPVPGYDEQLAAIAGRHLWRFQLLDTQMQLAHVAGTHHLAFLAVEPRAHSSGYGTALLQHHHAQLDALGLSAYLEASHPRNRALYTRLGYTPLHSTIQMPDDGPAMWPMLKAPRPAA